MARIDNLTNFMTDVSTAIKGKLGDETPISAANFDTAISSIPTGGGGFTGSLDVAGLKEIGWTDSDIAFYQEHGIDWDAEDDAKYMVSAEEKALYGMLTVNNVRGYMDIIQWLPLMDIPNGSNLNALFEDFVSLKGVPKMNPTGVLNKSNMFVNCFNLTCCDAFLTFADNSEARSMFSNCSSLKHVGEFQIPGDGNVATSSMFDRAGLVETITPTDIYSKMSDASYMYADCRNITYAEVTCIGNLSYSITSINGLFQNCINLKSVKIISSNNSSGTSLFRGCAFLEKLEEGSYIDAARWLSFNYLFADCPKLDFNSIDLRNYKPTRAITSLYQGTNVTNNFFDITDLFSGSGSAASVGDTFNGCFNLETAPINVTLSTSNQASAVYQRLYYNCPNLTYGGSHNFIVSTRDPGAFLGKCPKLTTFSILSLGGSIDFTGSDNVSASVLVSMINSARSVSGKTMTLGAVNLAKLTTAQKAVATNKGWVLA